MVKAIVLYNSRGGNTKKVAMKIAEGLGVECKDHRHIPDLKDYDLVVVGTWIIMGRISFAGARYLRKLQRRNLAGKKVALFMTSGGPDEINPFTEKDPEPKTIKEVAFNQMEKNLKRSEGIEILQERFVCKGAIRMWKNAEPKDLIGHPSDEELAEAKAFGERLKKI